MSNKPCVVADTKLGRNRVHVGRESHIPCTPFQWPPFMLSRPALRLCPAPAAILYCVKGALTDKIGAAQTAVYEVGCNAWLRGMRRLTSMLDELTPRNSTLLYTDLHIDTYVHTDQIGPSTVKSCANRRVTCDNSTWGVEAVHVVTCRNTVQTPPSPAKRAAVGPRIGARPPTPTLRVPCDDLACKK